MANTATFIGTDGTTLGNWPGVYGADGGGTTDAHTDPSYAVTTNGISAITGSTGLSSDSHYPYSWAAPTDGTTRQTAFWNPIGPPPLNFDVALTGAVKCISFYLFNHVADTDTSEVDVLDLDTLAPFDHQDFSHLQTIPLWYRWNITGNIRFAFKWSGGGGIGGSIAAFMFDPAVVAAPVGGYSRSRVVNV